MLWYILEKGRKKVTLLEVMDRRISVRTFSEEAPEGELFDKIKRVVERERKGPFGNRYSMTLMDVDSDNSQELGKMTSYGVLKNARFFFGGVSDGDDRAVIDYAYCFEQVILELTAAGLGTCWMGGTFGRGFIAKMLNLPEGKVIPAISPVGFSHEKRSAADKITRIIAGSRNRKPQGRL